MRWNNLNKISFNSFIHFSGCQISRTERSLKSNFYDNDNNWYHVIWDYIYLISFVLKYPKFVSSPMNWNNVSYTVESAMWYSSLPPSLLILLLLLLLLVILRVLPLHLLLLLLFHWLFSPARFHPPGHPQIFTNR